MLCLAGVKRGGSTGIILRPASRCRMALLRASMGAYAMSFSMRPCSRLCIRHAGPCLCGGRITMERAHTLNWAGKHLPSSPNPSSAGRRRCATPPAPRRLPAQKPPFGDSSTARTNSRLDKSWGQGHQRKLKVNSLAEILTIILTYLRATYVNTKLGKWRTLSMPLKKDS